LPSPASPVLRVLRRLIGRDPETPIRLEIGVSRASLAASLGAAIRPVGLTVGELLGRNQRAASVESVGAPVGAMARFLRYRRLISLSACLVLVAVAAVGAIPPVSASGGPDPAAGSTAPAGGTAAGADPVAASQIAADPSVDAGSGDGAVYNVIQAVELAPGSGDFQVYVVAGGDNLNKIGARFGLSRNTIYWANTTRLPNPASIRVGLRLLIPPADGITVTVKASNTLSGFASKYKVTVQKIMSANVMSDATLTAGQLLVIPVAQVPAIPTPKPPAPAVVNTVWTGVRLRWPVPASHTITQYYSASHHPAIDIGAPTGTPVVAAVNGKVIWAGWKTSGGGLGGGIEVWIASGTRMYTTYNHLSAEFVRVGQVVTAGQRIGSVGMTGNATGPHLHFEVWACFPWTGGTTACARNPMRYF
jgi:murein DD-endopeptidase MepM/ murein hydrolase activator NlpD